MDIGARLSSSLDRGLRPLTRSSDMPEAGMCVRPRQYGPMHGHAYHSLNSPASLAAQDLEMTRRHWQPLDADAGAPGVSTSPQQHSGSSTSEHDRR